MSEPDPPRGRPVVECPGIRFAFYVRESVFAKQEPTLRIGKEERRLAVIVDLFKADRPTVVRWADVGLAYLAFGFEINGRDDSAPFESRRDAGKLALHWGDLESTGAIEVGTIQAQDAAYAETRAGRPVPQVRL